MNQFERINLTLQHTPKVGKGFNSVMHMHNYYSSIGVVVSTRTIRRDFAQLEQTGHVLCVDFDGKWKLFSQPQKPETSMNPELALVLSQLEHEIVKYFPASVLKALSAQLGQAKEMIRKSDLYNPNDRIVRFLRSTAGISFSKYTRDYTADPIVLKTIFDAIFDETELQLTHRNDNRIYIVDSIKLVVLDDRLFLSAKDLTKNHSSICFEVTDITCASVINYSRFSSTLSLNRAA